MNCRQVRDILPELVSGELDSKAKSDAMHHINVCVECQSEMLKYKAALGVLENAWNPVQTPPALDSLTLLEIRQARLPVFHLSLVGACLAVLILVLIVIPRIQHRNVTSPMQQVLIQPNEDHQPQPNKLPEIQPNKKSELEEKNTVKPESAPELKPDTKIENKQPEPKFDKRRFRPRRNWDYCKEPDKQEKQIKEEQQTASEDSKPETDQSEYNRDSVASSNIESIENPSTKIIVKPVAQKITRPIVTYDRYGNKQVTSTEAEEHEKPLEMAFY